MKPNNLVKLSSFKSSQRINNYCLDEVELLSKLISFESVTPDYSQCQPFIMEELSKLGFKVSIYECFDELDTYNPKVYNLYATIGGGSKALLFCGHSDVVPSGEGWSFAPFGGRIIDGYVCGRGSEDMKSGIACFMTAISHFLVKKGVNFEGKIGVLISGAEEDFAKNGIDIFSKFMRKNQEFYDVCITGEPTSQIIAGDAYEAGGRGKLDFSSKISGDLKAFTSVLLSLFANPLDNGYKEFPASDIVPVGVDFFVNSNSLNEDSCFIKIDITGQQGHSSLSHLAVNPIVNFIDIIKALDSENITFETILLKSDFIAFNVIPPFVQIILKINKSDIAKVKEISLKTNRNSIIFIVDKPDIKENKANILIDFRFNPNWDFKKLEQEITNRIDKALKHFDAEAENSFKLVANSYFSQGEVLFKIIECAAKELNISTQKNIDYGSSDTRFIFREQIAKECTDLGVVSKTMHKVDEKTSIVGLKTLTKLYEKILEDFFA